MRDWHYHVNASSGRLYVSTAPDLCPLLDFTLESENPALNRVVQLVTLPQWFVILLFSKGMPAAWNKSFILFDNVLISIDWTLNLILLSLPLFPKGVLLNLPSLGIYCKYLSKSFTIHLGLDGSLFCDFFVLVYNGSLVHFLLTNSVH